MFRCTIFKMSNLAFQVKLAKLFTFTVISVIKKAVFEKEEI